MADFGKLLSRRNIGKVVVHSLSEELVGSRHIWREGVCGIVSYSHGTAIIVGMPGHLRLTADAKIAKGRLSLVLASLTERFREFVQMRRRIESSAKSFIVL
ncbi:unnamed protein product [Calypogeia fissa]